MQRSLYNAGTPLKAQPWWSHRETGYMKDLAYVFLYVFIITKIKFKITSQRMKIYMNMTLIKVIIIKSIRQRKAWVTENFGVIWTKKV